MVASAFAAAHWTHLSASSQSVHQYGAATTKENSPHYSDQSLLFANRQLKNVWFSKEEIMKNLEDSYHPGERHAK